jgi:hypothetical protein
MSRAHFLHQRLFYFYFAIFYLPISDDGYDQIRDLEYWLKATSAASGSGTTVTTNLTTNTVESEYLSLL